MSLDGRIATKTGESQWITSEQARHDAQRLRRRADAVMVGIGTVLADDPLLVPRDGDEGVAPVRVVLDTELRLPTTSQLVRTAREVPVWVVHGADALEERRERLRSLGVVTVAVPRHPGERARIADVMQALGERDIVEVLVEGGSTVHGALVDERVGDAVVCYVAPRIIGGPQALSAFGGSGVERLALARRLGAIEVEHVGPDLRLSAEFEDVHGDR